MDLNTVNKHYLKRGNKSNNKKVKSQNFGLTKAEQDMYIKEQLYFKYGLLRHIANSHKKKGYNSKKQLATIGIASIEIKLV